MNMHEAIDDDTDDTLSLSNLHIYSDPSSSSNEEEEDEDDYGSSFSSFRFKIISSNSPQSEKIGVFGKSISAPDQTDLIPYRKPQKPSRIKTFPVKDDDDDGFGRKQVVVIPRRRAGKWFLMFGLGARMELSDLRSRKARGGPSRIAPVNGGGGGGGEEVVATARRRSGNWSGKLFGSCIPIV